MKCITPKELKEKLDRGDDFLLLDIRESYEQEICNIGGIQIPMAEVIGRIKELDLNREIVVMCRSGRRAGALVNLLIEEYKVNTVSMLEGGILAWIDQIDPRMEKY